MAIDIGNEATVDHSVSSAHTAVALGSGDVEVLGTPQVVAWCEGATVAAISPGLAAGETTVGTLVEIEHLRATAVGGEVRVHARLVDIDGRRLTFEVDAIDGGGRIASGRVVRMIVDRAKFISRLPTV